MNPITLLDEAKNVKMFLETDRKEIEAIEAEIRNGDISHKERLEELFDLVNEHVSWLKNHAEDISKASRLVRPV